MSCNYKHRIKFRMCVYTHVSVVQCSMAANHVMLSGLVEAEDCVRLNCEKGKASGTCERVTQQDYEASRFNIMS